MARLPRIIVPGVPHQVTQRGNRRQRVFIEDDDYALYKDWLAQSCSSNGVAVWSYCLMPNHVHLVLVPSDDTGLSRAVGETHRRYSGYINSRLRVTGHLFQGRFGCVAMDEAHLMTAFRYVALNPVKAKLVLRCRPNGLHRCKIRDMEALAKPPASPVPFQARPTEKRNGTPRRTPVGQAKRKKHRTSLHNTWQRPLLRNMQRNDQNVAIGTAT
jgi:REP element-mobilizing transposase RayT